MPDDEVLDQQPAATEAPPDPTPESTPQQPEPEAQPVAADVDEDREPGGDTPDAVFARKAYRESKRLKNELAQRDRELARMQERERLIAQTAQAQSPELTIDQVQKAISSGELDAGLGARWLARHEAQNVVQQISAERAVLTQREHLRSELREYTELVPGLSQRGSAAVERVESEMARLESMGYPSDDRTVRIAVELAHGSIEQLRQKKGVDSMTRTTLAPHNERPAGGTPPTNGKLNLKDAPADLQMLWDKQNTPEASRLKQLKFYQERQEARAARFQSFTGRGPRGR